MAAPTFLTKKSREVVRNWLNKAPVERETAQLRADFTYFGLRPDLKAVDVTSTFI